MKRRSYRITLSNASHQTSFTRCTWFEVFHDNPPHPLQPPKQIIDGKPIQVQKWKLWCVWHCVSTSCNCNLLLQRSMRLRQCIVNCVTKGTQSNSGSERTPHINDLQYTIRYFSLRSIVGYIGNMCGYGGDRSVGKNGWGCKRRGDGSGGHINKSKRRVNAR